jgi:hypothetical protein
MTIKNLQVLLSNYRCTIVDPPCPKTKDDGNGGEVVVVDRNGVTQFVVALFLKAIAGPGERAPKGEEIKVTLATDPGPGFEEDTRVELIGPRINSYQIDTDDGRSISGLAFKALGLKPASTPAVAQASGPSGAHGLRGGEDR